MSEGRADVARLLIQWRQLDAKRTQGEWHVANGKGSASVAADDCAIYVNVRTVEIDETVERWQADARAIVHAVNHFGALCAEVERLRRLAHDTINVAESHPCPNWTKADVERLRALRSAITDPCPTCGDSRGTCRHTQEAQ